MDKEQKALVLAYFASTTLTTIGLGDYVPKSNFERLIGTLMMISGIAMFSMMNSKVERAINKLRHITSPLNEVQNELESFFGVLKRFNGNCPIEKSLRMDIENFFEFRWEKDKTQALKTQQDRHIFEQLPHIVQYRIYHDFLYDEFLGMFFKAFRIKQNRTEVIMGMR